MGPYARTQATVAKPLREFIAELDELVGRECEKFGAFPEDRRIAEFKREVTKKVEKFFREVIRNSNQARNKPEVALESPAETRSI